jgi:hypothetical protein
MNFATDGVVRVGGGRGFVVEHRTLFDPGSGFHRVRRKVIVTASHCLPRPPKMPCYSYKETTFAKLLAPLGEEPSVWAECLFFDPVADVAMFGELDSQELSDEWDDYYALVADRKPFALAAPNTGEGYILALDGTAWTPTPLRVFECMLGRSLSSGPIIAGQSGSPILDGQGRAVALVSVGTEISSNGVKTPHESGPQPILKNALPPWLLTTMKLRHSR